MMISRRFFQHITMKFCLKLKFNFQRKSVLSPWITKEILKSFKIIQRLYEKLLKRETQHCKEYKNLLETNEVACVVKLELVFMEWFFYSLVIHQVIQNSMSKFRQSSAISEKPGYLSEKLKTLTCSGYHKV